MLRLSIIFIFATVIVLFAGCSAHESPVSTSDKTISGSANLPVGVTDWASDVTPSGGSGALGLFNLHIDMTDSSAELTPLRNSALADVLEVVDLTNFLKLAPCTDCAKIKSVSLDADGKLVVSIGIKHPFPAGDPLKPVTGRNRADLHVFNVEGIVVSNASATSFAGLGQKVAGFGLANADGYTGYLDNALDEIYPTDATVHPYILHFDDYSVGNFDASNPMGFASVTDPPPSGNLVMAMGCDYNVQDYVFDLPSEPIDFIYAVGCTYALSAASKSQRFTPEYRVPQHNKKAASEVGFNIVSNGLKGGDTSSTAQIEVHVVDISHGVAVGDALNQMRADSSVKDIRIDIPGVTSAPVIIDGGTPISGTGHSPSDPLIYAGTITNSVGAPEGNYPGLVKVTDNYAPGQNETPSLKGMDGIKRVDPMVPPTDGLFAISEFATYQVFNIDVASGVQLTVTSIVPDNGTQHSVVNDAIIAGTGFVNVTAVRLEKDAEIVNAATFNVDSGIQITADFDLDGHSAGLYDVVVEVQGGGTGVLPDGFEIQFECGTGIHNSLQYEGTYQLHWGTNPNPTWLQTYDIASLPDGRVLMQGFTSDTSGITTLMAFDVTQNGLVNGDVIISGQWGSNTPNWIMSMDVCDITGNIIFVLASNSGKMLVFDSTGHHVQSLPSSHDVFDAVDTDWQSGIWTVEYILDTESPPLGKAAFIEHYKWDGAQYIHMPSDTVEITNDLELNPCKVTEMGIVFTAKRLIILEHSSANPPTTPWRGNMYNYDLSSGKPVLMPSLTQKQFCSTPLSESQINHWRKAFDIEIDHSDPLSEECRIMIGRRSGLGWTDGSYFAKYDINMNKLAEYHVAGTPTQDHLLETFTLCPNPDDPDGIFLTIHEGWLSHPLMDHFEVFKMPVGW